MPLILVKAQPESAEACIWATPSMAILASEEPSVIRSNSAALGNAGLV